MPLKRTSKLEAVNRMLDGIYQEPVSALPSVSDPGTYDQDAWLAETILDQTLRDFLAEGHHFNTLEKCELVPTSTGRVYVDENVLSIDGTEGYNGDKDLTERWDPEQNRSILYDLKNKTSTFTGKLYVDIVEWREFNHIPEPARYLVMIRAANRLAASQEMVDPFDGAIEAQALQNFKRSESRNKDMNFLDNRIGRKVRGTQWRLA